MLDIRHYSDDELSLIVFNDETLYYIRRNLKQLRMYLNEMYVYNTDQWNVLVQDINDDLTEE